MTLFEQPKTTQPQDTSGTPLADRMRPRTLDEFVGQEHLVGKGKILREIIENDRPYSIIFWGPPGSGKTTLAKIIAEKTKSRFISFSAVTSGIKQIKEIMEVAGYNKREQNIKTLIKRALSDSERGLGKYNIKFSNEAIDFIAGFSDGDARIAYNILELAVGAYFRENKQKTLEIDTHLIENIIQKKALLYDKNGEEHFNIISALHKRLRDSDPDAAVYWIVRMLEGGEDPLYILKRMVRFASEDIGLADPNALTVT